MITGDIRSVAHGGDPLALCRLAWRTGDIGARRYMAEASRRWAPSWALEWVEHRDAHALVARAMWSKADPLDCLTEGVLSLDGEAVWSVPGKRPALEWLVAECWSVLPVYEAWAAEHSVEHLHAPRRAVEALHGWLRGEVSRGDLRSAADAANTAADAAWAAVDAYAAAWVAAAAAAYADAYAAARPAAYAAYAAVDAEGYGLDRDEVRDRQRRTWIAHALHCALAGRQA